MIIQTTAGQFFTVTEIGLPQAWEGIELKANGLPKTGKPVMVRKAGCIHAPSAIYDAAAIAEGK
jgi:hypothetical protein